MLPECYRGSRFSGGILNEATARPEEDQRRGDILYRKDVRESREDRFDLICTPIIGEIAGRRGGVSHTPPRMHLNYPAQQQEGGKGLTSSRNASGILTGLGRTITILSKVLGGRCSRPYLFIASVGSVSSKCLNSGSRHALAWILPQSSPVISAMDLHPSKRLVAIEAYYFMTPVNIYHLKSHYVNSVHRTSVPFSC